MEHSAARAARPATPVMLGTPEADRLTDALDLVSVRVGGEALFATDEFFAPKENLLQPQPAVFIPGKYTEFGKWMDGWESRRKRTPGYDHCLLRLGIPGRIQAFEVDTAHFLGNFPEHCSIDAAAFEGNPSVELLQHSDAWVNLVPILPLQGGTRNLFAVQDERRFTHIRLNIYPDGGVARFRVYGEALPDWALMPADALIDLAAVENGGIALLCNDMFFSHRNNLIMPGRSVNMGDGWETRRKRGAGHDWLILRLGARGMLERIEVDTNHFKGNFPESCSIEGADLGAHAETLPSNFLSSRSIAWTELLSRTPLQAHHRHFYEADALATRQPFTHIRLNIFPDGGVSRLRLWGRRVLSSRGQG